MPKLPLLPDLVWWDSPIPQWLEESQGVAGVAESAKGGAPMGPALSIWLGLHNSTPIGWGWCVMSVPIKVLGVDAFAISSGNIGDRDNSWEIKSATVDTAGSSGLEVVTRDDDIHDEFIPVALGLWNE